MSQTDKLCELPRGDPRRGFAGSSLQHYYTTLVNAFAQLAKVVVRDCCFFAPCALLIYLFPGTLDFPLHLCTHDDGREPSFYTGERRSIQNAITNCWFSRKNVFIRKGLNNRVVYKDESKTYLLSANYSAAAETAV